MERQLDGFAMAQDALGLITVRLQAGLVAREDDVRMCAGLLRMAAATIEGALTIHDERASAATSRLPTAEAGRIKIKQPWWIEKD
jgi:hypothetical protein